MQTVINNPLLVREKDFSVNKSSVSGSVCKRYFTVFNLGKQEAEINISVTASDDKSEPLQNWCFIEPNPLILESGHSRDIVLSFDIPHQAKPDLYNYEVLFEAPEQYPNKFFRCVQELIISRVDREPEWGEAPQFSVCPSNSSAEPYCIQPEGKLKIVVKVKNCSHLVDSFELSCPDLDPEWYTIQYPERDLKFLGLITEIEGLKLNPDKEGEITLILHPPKLTLASNYVRTMQLTSQNRNNLVLLEALYLRVIPDDRLDAQIAPSRQELPEQPGEFEITVTNQGNIVRELDLRVEDNTSLYTYQLNNKQLCLQPGEKKDIDLIASPRWFMGWRRPWRGAGLESRFSLILENSDDYILPETKKAPALPRKLPQGIIILSPRPRWQLIVIILAIITALGGVLFSLWWLLLRLPPVPNIREFKVTKVKDEETEAETVLFDWQIKNLQQIDKLEFTSLNSKNKQEDQTDIDFGYCNQDTLERCIPRYFADFCQVEDKGMSCSQVPNQALPPEKYTFELRVFPKKAKKLLRKRSSTKAIDFRRSATIIVDSTPTPQIDRIKGLVASKLNYQQETQELIGFQWDIVHNSQLKKLNVIQRVEDNPIRVYSYEIDEETKEIIRENSSKRKDRLVCQPSEKHTISCNWSINSDLVMSGKSTFSVELFSIDNLEEPTDILATRNLILIEPRPLPQIEQFTVSQNKLREGGIPIRLSWKIKHFQEIDSLSIKSISADGSSQLLNQYQYPQQLGGLCVIPQQVDKSLVCNNIALAPLPVGNYKFQLLVEPKQQASPEREIGKYTDTVVVEPKPLIIKYFTINGKKLKNGETFLHPLQKNTPTSIKLAWSVSGGSGIKVELLPIGGQQNSSGSLNHYLKSGQEIITLQVTDERGKQKTHSVQIQTYEPKSSPFPSLNRQTTTNQENINKSRPTILEPIELSPKAQ